MAEEGQAFKENFDTTGWSEKHISENDKMFNDALMEQGINAKLYMQAANSPDVILLDLGFLEPPRVSMMLLQKTKRD